MKGLPFKGGKDDIAKFFAGFSLRTDQVFLRKHPDGRPNGEAFVEFSSADEARRATQKDRETFGEKFGDRYVRVYPTLESDVPEMQAAVAQAQQQEHSQGSGNHGHGAHSDSVVKIKSLPFDATQLDIIQFFDTFKLKPNGVQLVVRSDNKPTGEAFVDFVDPDEAARSIKERDHKVFSEKFGDRYVRLIQVSRKEMQATLALRFGGEGVLKMKGIPFKATAMDVRKFFAGYKIKVEGISFIMHADGRPTGMAFIEFETPQEAVRAMEKDRAKFGPEYGDRFCMLQLVGRHEMEKVTLQRENENTANKLLNGINVLQAAAYATQAALNNPALQPILMAGSNPWLSPIYPGMGLVGHGSNSAAAALANAQLAHVQPGGPGQMLDATALSAAAQPYAPSLQGHPSLVNGGMHALSLLHQQQQAHAVAGGVDPSSWGLDAAAAAASNNLQLFYQNAAAAPDWARAAAAAAAASDPRMTPLSAASNSSIHQGGVGAGGELGRFARQQRNVTYPGLDDYQRGGGAGW
ncbi:Heterogeneous nuclear ribonucleoprotein H [Tetrabaena socialis]|uniref:Heterogeneous nuclear ribonucleoprotein H n=1 Tax=Tetrabaena socialis TaxID=47790 RepID=A0A2J7ZZT9_9CHLO|nr:Heterogeneous nuclear ribonucleoprotein H [Tetrabaena socialis]|eukprot:PNH05775.1 Heterogeneous nuclear ribonucleoprotein H [Tetrabaena socialis]